jgi:hypothetical protein
MEENHPIDRIIDRVQEYVETRSRLSKLQAIDKGAELAGTLTANLIIVFLFLLVIGFLSVAGAYALGEYFGRIWLGFLIVGLAYLLACLVFYWKQESWLKLPMSSSIIRHALKEEEEHDEDAA